MKKQSKYEVSCEKIGRTADIKTVLFDKSWCIEEVVAMLAWFGRCQELRCQGNSVCCCHPSPCLPCCLSQRALGWWEPCWGCCRCKICLCLWWLWLWCHPLGPSGSREAPRHKALLGIYLASLLAEAMATHKVWFLHTSCYWSDCARL